MCTIPVECTNFRSEGMIQMLNKLDISYYHTTNSSVFSGIFSVFTADFSQRTEKCLMEAMITEIN